MSKLSHLESYLGHMIKASHEMLVSIIGWAVMLSWLTVINQVLETVFPPTNVIYGKIIVAIIVTIVALNLSYLIRKRKQ